MIPFVRDLALHGDRPALLTADRVVSYAEVCALVANMADQLAAGGDRRLVLLGAANRPGAIVAYLGALAAGHVVLLADGDDARTMSAMRDAYDPDVVFRPRSSGADEWSIEQRRQGSAHKLHPDLALLLSTSGSTGSPKVVRLSHENVQSNAAAIADYLGISDADRAATTLPMHYCYGLSVIHSHLLAGAGLIVTDLSVVDRCFWDLFRARRATSFAGVPYTFDLLERVGFGTMEVPSLRYVTQAGGRLDPERVRRFARMGHARGWDLYVMYGQTEATARMAYLPPALAANQPGLIGVPITGGSFRIDPLPDLPHDAGELVYHGPNVMLGYANGPSDLALGRTFHELRTGDIARENADGMYEIIGRRSGFVKVAGLRVELDQVERNLALVGLTAACAGADDELVVAVITDRDAAAVRPTVLEALGLPGRAVRVVAVPDLARLPSGKVDRVRIVELAERDVPAPTRAAAADTSGSDRVRTLYADVLERDARPTDTFVGLGGDSLSYVQASLGLEEMIGRLPETWPTMTVAELGALAEGRSDARSGIVRRALALRSVETSVALRALAILLIVATHAGALVVPAGAHVLFAVAGFNFARFQLTSAARWERVRSQMHSLVRVVVPAVLWIAAMLALTRDYELHSLFLVNSIVGAPTWTNGWQFWFIEMLVYLLVAMTALSVLPGFDRAERRWRFAVPMAVLAVGLVFRFGILDFGIPHPKPVLWLFALGWAASRASSTRERLLVFGVAAVALPGFFGDLQRELIILGGIGMLTFARSLRIPAVAAPVLGVVASASLYVYLVHWQVYPRLEAWPDVVAVAASVLAGICLWAAAERVTGAVGRVRRAAARLVAGRRTPSIRPLKLSYKDVVATG